MTESRSATTTSERAPAGSPNRWLILVAAVLVQLAIGAVYAWSVFGKAMQAEEAFVPTTVKAEF